MSGAGSVIATILTAVPMTFGATRRMHERWLGRWRLRYHDLLDADAREGDLVFVGGIVRALDETLVAPLSGRTCVAYRSRVSARTFVSGKTEHETMQIRPFVIERDGGEGPILVDSERAIFVLAAEKLSPRNPEREASFLARHAIKSASPRFSEVLVPLGAHVYVGATLVLVPPEEPPGGERGFRDPPPPEPQLVGSREAPLLIVARDR